jgi:hypothetical protein
MVEAHELEISLAGPAGLCQVTTGPLALHWSRHGQLRLRCAEPACFETTEGAGQARQVTGVARAAGSLAVAFATGDPAVVLLLTVRAEADGFAVQWQASGRPVTALEDRFDLASGKHWYGQGELLHQVWPLEQISLPRSPLRT